MRRQSCSLWAYLGKEAFPLPSQLHLGRWVAHKAHSHQQTSSNISNLREGPETAHPESPVICQEALEHFLTVYNGGQRLGSLVGSSIIQVTAHQHTWIKLYFRISHRFCSCEYLSPCPTHHRTHKPLGTLPHTQELFSSLSCLASSICKTSLEPALESGSVLPDCTWP